MDQRPDDPRQRRHDLSRSTREAENMSKTILITGASGGYGKMTAYSLADAGHTVYARYQGPQRRTSRRCRSPCRRAQRRSQNGRADGQDQASVERAIQTVIDEKGGLDVLVHNAGHMVLGAAEAFTPEQYS